MAPGAVSGDNFHMVRINDDLWIDEDELSFEFARSSGPGGQNVNKVETKVRLAELRSAISDRGASGNPHYEGRRVARFFAASPHSRGEPADDNRTLRRVARRCPRGGRATGQNEGAEGSAKATVGIQTPAVAEEGDEVSAP
jgi:hypothetical protein